MDPNKREQLVDQIQVIHARDLPTLPMYYADSFWAYDDRIDMYYIKRGIAMGTPIAQNKLSFLKWMSDLRRDGGKTRSISLNF